MYKESNQRKLSHIHPSECTQSLEGLSVVLSRVIDQFRQRFDQTLRPESIQHGLPEDQIQSTRDNCLQVITDAYLLFGNMASSMDNKKDMDIVYLEDEEMSGKILSSLRSRVDDIIFLALGTTLEKYHAAVIDAVREYGAPLRIGGAESVMMVQNGKVVLQSSNHNGKYLGVRHIRSRKLFPRSLLAEEFERARFLKLPAFRSCTASENGSQEGRIQILLRRITK